MSSILVSQVGTLKSPYGLGGTVESEVTVVSVPLELSDTSSDFLMYSVTGADVLADSPVMSGSVSVLAEMSSLAVDMRLHRMSAVADSRAPRQYISFLRPL